VKNLKVRLSKCSISSEEINAVKKVLESEYLGMGAQVLEFERNIKSYLDTSMSVVCVNTGTSALQLALSAIGIGHGDEVLVPSLTYIASFQAISATGANPIACEVNQDTLFIDVHDAKSKITANTKAIMPVHYASSSKGMGEVYTLAKKHKLRVIEDAAQAFGCNRDSKKIGKKGDIICFSFDGIKNITSGEGGAILTNDEKVLQRLRDGRLLSVQNDTENRFSGNRSWDFDVKDQGFRFHMSNINAVIGIEQLKKISFFRKKRQDISERYIRQLKEIQNIEFLKLNYLDIIPHIFVVKAHDRDGLRRCLMDSGIECGIHYKPNHLLTKYNTNFDLPVTEEIYKKILTLPCHVDLSIRDQDMIIFKIKEFYNGGVCE